jgi:hypothetical protein
VKLPRLLAVWFLALGTSIFCLPFASANESPAPTLSAPFGVTAQVDSTTVTVKWGNPGDTAVTAERFAVMWQTNTSNGWGIASYSKSILIPIEIIRSTAGNGTYMISVRADNDTLHVYSNWSDFVLIEITAPVLTPSPSSEPTAVPSPSSSPEPSPTPTAEPTPAPSPEPTVTPTPAPSPTNTPESSASPTPIPSPDTSTVTPVLPVPPLTPEPQPTPAPVELTPIPVAPPTVEPTPQPTPLPTQQPQPTPLPEPVLTQPDPVDLPPVAAPLPEPSPEPAPVPEPLPQPEPAPEIPAPEPAPEPLPIAEEPPVPVEEPPAEEQPPVATPDPEPAPVEEPPAPEPEVTPVPPTPAPAPEPAPLPPVVPNVVPPVVATIDSTPAERAAVAETLIVAAQGEPVTAQAIQDAGLIYEDLPPQTPVEVRQDENGNEVVITAEVAAALVVLESPAAFVSAIFTNPSQALLALASIGADMSVQERAQAQKIVVASIIAGQAAVNAASMASVAAYRRKP